MPHAVFNSVLVTSSLIKYEHAPGTTFVAISRLPRLSCGLIMPMPFQRLNRFHVVVIFLVAFKNKHVFNNCQIVNS